MDIKQKLKRAWNRPPKKVRKIYYLIPYVSGVAFIVIGLIFYSFTVGAGEVEFAVNHLLVSVTGVMFLLCGYYKHRQYNTYKDQS